MKIEKINENKIKITISNNDLQDRNIDLASLNYNSPAAQELFWDMMEQAESKFGFNASESQLCVEASPDIEEGFVITITRLKPIEEDAESSQKYLKKKFNKKSDIKLKKKSHKVLSTNTIYSFVGTDELSMMSHHIADMYAGESFLYKHNNLYYLILSKNNWVSDSSLDAESILNEYGTKISNVSFYEGYLNEYGIKIADGNALEIINKYF